MADDTTNEDSWLYGDSNAEEADNNEQTEQKTVENEESNVEAPKENEEDKPEEPNEQSQPPEEQSSDLPPPPAEEVLEASTNGTEEPTPMEVGEGATDEGEAKKDENTAEGENEDEDDDEDDSDDDDVQVTIGDIKTSTTYAPITMKRGLASDKNKQPGKFSIEEFEAVGTINTVAAHEFNLDSLEDKPWRKPGADITDYFNYGFNEDTWRAYCERQKRIRVHDSGIGLGSLGGPAKATPGSIPVTIINDNSKYSGIAGPKKAGPPPGRKYAGSIDVIGGNPNSSRRSLDSKAGETTPTTPEVQESPIQVMTADRREYGRPKPGFPDLSVPPPTFDMPPPTIETIQPYTGARYDNSDFFPPEADPYYQSYEPTQDLQWGQQPWEGVSAATNVVIPLGGDSNGRKSRDGKESREGRESSLIKEIKEEPGLEKEKSERHRESRHKHRSRSKSTERSSRSSKKRNKSRSRSPHRHRSKKKSRRERDDSE